MPFRPGVLSWTDSGLVIASKLPIVDWGVQRFSRGMHIDAGAAKGILHAKLQAGPREVFAAGGVHGVSSRRLLWTGWLAAALCLQHAPAGVALGRRRAGLRPHAHGAARAAARVHRGRHPPLGRAVADGGRLQHRRHRRPRRGGRVWLLVRHAAAGVGRVPPDDGHPQRRRRRRDRHGGPRRDGCAGRPVRRSRARLAQGGERAPSVDPAAAAAVPA